MSSGARDFLEERFWGVLLALLAAQLVGVVTLVRRAGLVVPLTYGLRNTATGIVGPLAVAVLARLVLGAVRQRSVRTAAKQVFRQGWEIGLVVVAYLLLAEAYMWGKVFVPAINPRLWDGTLAAVDRALCFGVDPNVALLTIFAGSPAAALALDRFYGLFVPSMLLATAWFSTGPPARRKGFFLAVAIVWSLGLWLYLGVPAHGPVYTNSGLWEEVVRVFPTAAATQLALLRNYQAVLALFHGARVAVSPTLGVAAMPSLHVAAQALFFLWCVRLETRWRTVFLITTGLTFLGAVATGWHWAVDGWAGIVIAAIGVRIGWAVTARFEKAAEDGQPVQDGSAL